MQLLETRQQSNNTTTAIVTRVTLSSATSRGSPARHSDRVAHPFKILLSGTGHAGGETGKSRRLSPHRCGLDGNRRKYACSPKCALLTVAGQVGSLTFCIPTVQVDPQVMQTVGVLAVLPMSPVTAPVAMGGYCALDEWTHLHTDNRTAPAVPIPPRRSRVVRCTSPAPSRDARTKALKLRRERERMLMEELAAESRLQTRQCEIKQLDAQLMALQQVLLSAPRRQRNILRDQIDILERSIVVLRSELSKQAAAELSGQLSHILGPGVLPTTMGTQH